MLSLLYTSNFFISSWDNGLPNCLDNNIASRRLFDECGVTYKKLKLHNENENGEKREIKIEL